MAFLILMNNNVVLLSNNGNELVYMDLIVNFPLILRFNLLISKYFYFKTIPLILFLQHMLPYFNSLLFIVSINLINLQKLLHNQIFPPVEPTYQSFLDLMPGEEKFKISKFPRHSKLEETQYPSWKKNIQILIIALIIFCAQI